MSTCHLQVYLGVAFLSVLAVNVVGHGAIDWKAQGHSQVSSVVSPPPASYLRPEDLPVSYDLRRYKGSQNMCGRVQTQQNPHVCGSCWAHAATGSLSDRFKLATAGAFTATLAPQVLLSFDKNLTGGSCQGGDTRLAFQFIQKFGITDDTCSVYRGMSFGDNMAFDANATLETVQSHMCHFCNWNGDCTYLPTSSVSKPKVFDHEAGAGAARRYSVDEFGYVEGEHAIMAEIFARGPVACFLNSEPEVFNNYTGGVIRDGTNYTKVDHVIVIAGWGVEPDGIKTWIGRNSFGTRWGEGVGGGWFRLERGANTLNMEKYGCVWATPSAADVAALRKEAGLSELAEFV